MGAEEVLEKILADAKAEAEGIKQQADAKETAEQTRLTEHLNEYNKQTELLAKKAAEDTRAHLLAAARMEIAKEYLAEKGRILDDVFEQAKTRVRNLPDAEYRELMTNLMIKAVQTGDEEMIVDAGETRIDRDFVANINRRLGPKKGGLHLSGQTAQLGAGFILKRDRIKTNASLEVLLAESRRQLDMELAKELFSQ